MSCGPVLHLFAWERKFALPFRDFIHRHFADGRHQFIVYGDVVESDVPVSSDTRIMSGILRNFVPITREINKAERIIIHGLFDSHLFYLLAIQPWLLKKCYWVMWGGDLYVHNVPKRDWRSKKNEFFRRFIVKRIGHLITYIKGDFELAKKWYGVKGQYHHCLMYPSNLYHGLTLPSKRGGAISILVGNSADPTNNHVEMFEKLIEYKNENIHILCPLSYGPADHAAHIEQVGKQLFKDKFTPLLDFLPFDEYLRLLGEVDIAVFAHKRQQAMGNTIKLLGLGKKVYMRPDVTPWKVFIELGVKVFDISELSLDPIDDAEKENNIHAIKRAFCETVLIDQYSDIFR